jgi:hypothetical protein
MTERYYDITNESTEVWKNEPGNLTMEDKNF